MMLEPTIKVCLSKKQSTSAFANSIEHIPTDKELRIKMGKAAHSKALRDYSTKTQVDKYVHTFSDALSYKDYSIIPIKNDLEHFVVPEITKPHILARILPLWFKKILKRYM